MVRTKRVLSRVANEHAKQIPFSLCVLIYNIPLIPLVQLMKPLALGLFLCYTKLLTFQHMIDTSSRVTACRSPAGILAKWVENLQIKYSPLPRNTTTHVLSLLFSEEDSHIFWSSNTLLALSLSIGLVISPLLRLPM
jgi:hypothetical protein